MIAGVVGAALLVGGSTYALWSQTADLGNTDIQSGDLELRMLDDAGEPGIQVWDVSVDGKGGGIIRVDFGGTIGWQGLSDFMLFGREVFPHDPVNPWRAVPQDHLRITIPFAMTLDGSNLVARLDANVVADQADNPTLASHVTTTRWMVQRVLVNESGAGSMWPISGTNLVTTDTGLKDDYDQEIYKYLGVNAYFVTTQYSDVNVPVDASQPLDPGVETYFLLTVDVTFDDVSEDQATNAFLDFMQALNLSLTQVRGDSLAAAATG